MEKQRRTSVQVPTFYEVLGVNPSASDAELKKAYRDQARASHPDTHPNSPIAESRCKTITRAYYVLSDPKRRSEYDQGRVVRENFTVEQFLKAFSGTRT